jgi:hypothetical protein
MQRQTPETLRMSEAACFQELAFTIVKLNFQMNPFISDYPADFLL